MCFLLSALHDKTTDNQAWKAPGASPAVVPVFRRKSRRGLFTRIDMLRDRRIVMVSLFAFLRRLTRFTRSGCLFLHRHDSVKRVSGNSWQVTSLHESATWALLQPGGASGRLLPRRTDRVPGRRIYFSENPWRHQRIVRKITYGVLSAFASSYLNLFIRSSAEGPAVISHDKYAYYIPGS